MTITAMRDIGATLLTRQADQRVVIGGNTSTAGFDSVAQTGLVIDRGAFKTDFLSCVVVCPLHAGFEVTATGEGTLNLAARLQDSTSSGGTFANHGSTGSSLRLTAASGASTGADGVLEIDVDLSGAAQFLRVSTTLTHGAAGTDTGGARANGQVHPVIVFGGGDENPAST